MQQLVQMLPLKPPSETVILRLGKQVFFSNGLSDSGPTNIIRILRLHDQLTLGIYSGMDIHAAHQKDETLTTGQELKIPYARRRGEPKDHDCMCGLSLRRPSNYLGITRKNPRCLQHPWIAGWWRSATFGSDSTACRIWYSSCRGCGVQEAQAAGSMVH